MSDTRKIGHIAQLLANGMHSEVIKEAEAAIQVIADQRVALNYDEQQLIHLKSSAEIILKIATFNKITSKLSAKVHGDSDIRKQRILDAALNIVNDGRIKFSVDTVKAELEVAGYILDVTRPGSVIGTILNGDKRFRRTEMGIFEYVAE